MLQEPDVGRRLRDDGPGEEKGWNCIESWEAKVGGEVGSKELPTAPGFPGFQPGALQRVQAGDQEQGLIKGCLPTCSLVPSDTQEG